MRASEKTSEREREAMGGRGGGVYVFERECKCEHARDRGGREGGKQNERGRMRETEILRM